MSKALLRFIRLSPTKARLVAREVQGMNVELALASLEFTTNKAARIIAKVIASAVANGGYDAQSAVVYSCRVDVGPVLRRFMPRARGRATPIRKPTSHILVEVLSESEANAKKAAPKNASKKLDSAKNTESKAAKKPASAKATASKSESKNTESKAKAAKDSASKAPKAATSKEAKKPKGEDK